MQLSKSFIIFALTGLPIFVKAYETAVSLAISLFEHEPPALALLHDLPYCGKACIFDPERKAAVASKCLATTKKKRFVCFCENHAFQLALNDCLKAECFREADYELVHPPRPSPQLVLIDLNY